MNEILPATEGIVFEVEPYRVSPECLRRLAEMERRQARNWAYAMAHPEKFLLD